ncbi:MULTISPECIES: hypothetical protein [Paracoccus]|nr:MULTISPECIES: hypothetical protein [Paracoccus]MBT0782299.1 hypothetical protein [Paracoccus sp. pheM1]
MKLAMFWKLVELAAQKEPFVSGTAGYAERSAEDAVLFREFTRPGC